MQKNKLITSVLLPVAVILPTLFPWGEANAQKQQKVRSTSLLKAECVNSGVGSTRKQKLNVSIGKAVYRSKFYLGPGYRSAALTCKIKPNHRPQDVFQSLNLGFGIPDNNPNSPSIQVRLYLDGQPTQAITVGPTQVANISVPIKNVNNVAIEARCTSATQYCNRVYFYNADLVQITPTANQNIGNPTQEQILEAPPKPPAQNKN